LPHNLYVSSFAAKFLEKLGNIPDEPMLFAGENFDEMRDGFSLVTNKKDLVCISCSTQEHNYHCCLP
jgi:hypothetical protein